MAQKLLHHSDVVPLREQMRGTRDISPGAPACAGTFHCKHDRSDCLASKPELYDVSGSFGCCVLNSPRNSVALPSPFWLNGHARPARTKTLISFPGIRTWASAVLLFLHRLSNAVIEVLRFMSSVTHWFRQDNRINGILCPKRRRDTCFATGKREFKKV
jgi:hypothetical protein